EFRRVLFRSGEFAGVCTGTRFSTCCRTSRAVPTEGPDGSCSSASSRRSTVRLSPYTPRSSTQRSTTIRTDSSFRSASTLTPDATRHRTLPVPLPLSNAAGAVEDVDNEVTSMLKLGVVGYGRRSHHMVRELEAFGTVRLHAVADPRVDELRAEFAAEGRTVALYEDVDEMLAHEKLD